MPQHADMHYSIIGAEEASTICRLMLSMSLVYCKRLPYIWYFFTSEGREFRVWGAAKKKHFDIKYQFQDLNITFFKLAQP